ncbi:hypothetical protein [Roseomonas sp. WA12]
MSQLAPFPFFRVEGHPRDPQKSKVAGQKQWSIRDAVAEMVREAGHCPHVAEPRAPVILVGPPPDEVAKLAERRAAEAHDPLGRSIRRDGIILVTMVASYPKTWKEVKASPEEEKRCKKWVKDGAKFIHRELGPDSGVLLHVDEKRPNLHGYGAAPVSPGETKEGKAIKVLDVGPIDPGRRARNEVRRSGGSWKAANRAAASAYRDLNFRFARDVSLPAGHRMSGLEGTGRRRTDAPTFREDAGLIAENAALKKRVEELEADQRRSDRLAVQIAAAARAGMSSGQEERRSGRPPIRRSFVTEAAQQRMGDEAPREQLQEDGSVILLPAGSPGERVPRSLLRSVQEARADDAVISWLQSELLAETAEQEKAEARAAAAERRADEEEAKHSATVTALRAEMLRRETLVAGEEEKARQFATVIDALRKAAADNYLPVSTIGTATEAEALGRAAPEAGVLVRSLVDELRVRPTRDELAALEKERDDEARRARAAEEKARQTEEEVVATRQEAARVRNQLRDANQNLRRTEDDLRGETNARLAAQASMAQMLDAQAGLIKQAKEHGKVLGRASAETELVDALGSLEIMAGLRPVHDVTNAIREARQALAGEERRAAEAEAAVFDLRAKAKGLIIREEVLGQLPAFAREHMASDAIVLVESIVHEVQGVRTHDAKLRFKVPPSLRRAVKPSKERQHPMTSIVDRLLEHGATGAEEAGLSSPGMGELAKVIGVVASVRLNEPAIVGDKERRSARAADIVQRLVSGADEHFKAISSLSPAGLAALQSSDANPLIGAVAEQTHSHNNGLGGQARGG